MFVEIFVLVIEGEVVVWFFYCDDLLIDCKVVV